MIIYEEGKISAISKNLLNTLSADLKEISNIINQLELETAVLNKKSINIKNHFFKIKKEDLITLKDISIFVLELEEKQENPLESLNTLKIEEPKEETILSTPNLIKEEKQENPLESLNTLKIEEPKEETVLSTPNLIKEEENPLESLNTLKIEEPKEKTILSTPNLIKEEESSLELSFEDDISKCEEIFSQSNMKDLVDKELQNAMQELGIDEEMAKELFEDLLEQIKEKKSSFYKAIKQRDYNELHEIAHYLKGASLNLRLSNLSFIFKTIDEESKKETNIQTIKKLIDDFYKFIFPSENNQTNIEEIASETNNTSNIKIDPRIKNMVLNTIQRYLETQNEKQFQKDKKFLEKLLNRKINSIKDLKSLWKDKQ